MNLVIVESPAKAKTIQKYLGKGFVVKSSFGHVRDLPKSVMGVDTDNNFEPKYLVPKKAKPIIKDLKAKAKTADIVYLATDEDREGEAIAWHLAQALNLKPEKTKRITFTEITKKAITEAIENPRELDINLIDAQQARRVLDRLVGYELSPLLWKKVRRGLSAGRVQSVAVRLISEREAEIKAFKPQEYWTITADLLKDNQTFKAHLTHFNNKKLDKFAIANEKSAQDIAKKLESTDYKVSQVESKEKQRQPTAPFITSTLQQAGVNIFGYSSKRTMMLAQQLYENGHITYMRTDSTNLSAESLTKAREVITSEFGPDYALDQPRVFKKKSKGAQEAHEAIRPTNPDVLPQQLASQLDPAQAKIYDLIWRRFTASQTAPAKIQTVTADIAAGTEGIFRATGSTITFDGFYKVLGKYPDQEVILPDLDQNDPLNLQKLLPEQHFTQPPARYSEATLVKTLEEKGIGRPSTYAPTIDTIQRREYVSKNDDKRFAPTEVGEIVNKLLLEHFPNIVDVDFTANMESSFDDIATGHKKWQPVINQFYQPFHKTIEKKSEELNKKDFTEEATGEKCDKCGGEMVIKLGRFGKFKACGNYPDCKNTEPIGDEKKLEEQTTGETCPDCGKPLVLKHGRFGPFLGCSGYPDCKHIKKIEKDTGVACPKCQKGKIVEKRSRKGKTFYACNQYPDCENAYWSKPTGDICPQCQSLLVFGPKDTIKCSNKDCGYQKDSE